MIYSIGYQKRTWEQVKAVMDETGVNILADVRSWPFSRHSGKYEFNRNQMEQALGSRYQWMGNVLGGKNGPAKEGGVGRLAALHANEHILMLLCMEDHPCDCHRLYDISRRLLKGYDIDVLHRVDDLWKFTSELTEEVCNGRAKK
jgi:uncharacterized protein (DUF488 family)